MKTHHNKVFLFVIVALIAISSVSAVNYYDVQGKTLGSSTSSTGGTITRFTMNQNVTITAVQKYTGDGSTIAYLYKSNVSGAANCPAGAAANGTFSGSIATLNTSVNYVSGQLWTWCLYSPGNTIKYGAGSEFPATGNTTIVSYPVNGGGGVSGTTDNYGRSYEGMHFYTSATIPVITVTLTNAINGSSWPVNTSFSNVTGNLTFSYFNITSTGYCVTYTGNGTGTNCTSGSGASTYFNTTNTTNIVGTQTVAASTYQSLLNITAKQLFTNNTIQTFNITNYLQTNTTTAGSLLVKANSGDNNVKIDVPGNYSMNATCSASSITTTSCTITGIYDNIYTIGAKMRNGTVIQNFTLTATNNTLGNVTTITTNGSVVMRLIQGYTYNMQMMATGYAYDNESLAANASTNAYNFSLFTKNSYNITFIDEETKAVITTQNVSIEFISDLFSTNSSTSNGRLYIDLLTPASYTLRYRANTYLERFYTVTLTDNTYNELNLTLLKASSGTNVTINVVDNIGNPLDGAVVKILKYDVNTNTYTINQIITTNFEGKGVATITLNTEFYKFIIEYDDEVVLSTAKTYVYGTTLTFQVSLSQSGFTEALRNADLSGTITFNNNTGVGSYTWTDAANTASQGCLYAYKVTNTTKTLLGTSCVSGSSGSTSISVAAGNNTYLFQGYVTSDGDEYLVTSYLYSYASNLPISRTLSLIITLILVVVLIFVARYSMEMAVILGSMGPLFLSITHLHSISIQASVGIFLLGIITAFIIGVKK